MCNLTDNMAHVAGATLDSALSHPVHVHGNTRFPKEPVPLRSVGGSPPPAGTSPPPAGNLPRPLPVKNSSGRRHRGRQVSCRSIAGLHQWNVTQTAVKPAPKSLPHAVLPATSARCSAYTSGSPVPGVLHTGAAVLISLSTPPPSPAAKCYNGRPLAGHPATGRRLCLAAGHLRCEARCSPAQWDLGAWVPASTGEERDCCWPPC